MTPSKTGAKVLMPGGAGDIPRGIPWGISPQISNSQAAVLTIKHSSRRGKLKIPIGILSPPTGHIKSIFPTVYISLIHSPFREESPRSFTRVFFHIILCLKQEFSPPWVTKPGISLFLAVT